jgi:hypothetical protein
VFLFFCFRCVFHTYSQPLSINRRILSLTLIHNRKREREGEADVSIIRLIRLLPLRTTKSAACIVYALCGDLSFLIDLEKRSRSKVMKCGQRSDRRHLNNVMSPSLPLPSFLFPLSYIHTDTHRYTHIQRHFLFLKAKRNALLHTQTKECTAPLYVIE